MITASSPTTSTTSTTSTFTTRGCTSLIGSFGYVVVPTGVTVTESYGTHEVSISLCMHVDIKGNLIGQ